MLQFSFIDSRIGSADGAVAVSYIYISSPSAAVLGSCLQLSHSVAFCIFDLFLLIKVVLNIKTYLSFMANPCHIQRIYECE